MATRQRKKSSDYGSVYKGHEGQWSWHFHRVTGVAIILFLFAHVVDTAVVGWGPEAYNRVASVYHNPIVRTLELGLVAAVLFHSYNGIKILLIDFFPRLARCEQLMKISAEAAERNRATCDTTAANFNFDVDHYVDFAIRLSNEFPFTILTEQATILRSEFGAQGLAQATDSVSRVLDDIELLRSGGPEMKPTIIDGWRPASP